jgi:TPR repeat protein
VQSLPPHILRSPNSASKSKLLIIGILLSVVGLLFSMRVLLVEATRPYTLWLDGVRLFQPGILAGSPAPLISPRLLKPWITDSSMLQGEYASCLTAVKTAQSQDNLLIARRACLHVLRAAVSGAPADGKLWLEIAIATAVLDGFGPQAVEALKHSYETAPREGWVAKNRLQFTLINWESLPEEIKDRTILDALDPWAKLALGRLLYSKESPFDEQRAIELLDQAGKRGDFNLLENLGRYHLVGEGVPLNPNKGRDYLERAIAGGNNDARIALGEALIRGQGVQKDVAAGLHLLEAAASIDEWGKLSLAKLLLSEDPPNDVPRALALLTSAAALDNFYALEILSDMYYEGEGVLKDPQKAKIYGERAVVLRNQHDAEVALRQSEVK